MVFQADESVPGFGTRLDQRVELRLQRHASWVWGLQDRQEQ